MWKQDFFCGISLVLSAWEEAFPSPEEWIDGNQHNLISTSILF